MGGNWLIYAHETMGATDRNFQLKLNSYISTWTSSNSFSCKSTIPLSQSSYIPIHNSIVTPYQFPSNMSRTRGSSTSTTSSKNTTSSNTTASSKHSVTEKHIKAVHGENYGEETSFRGPSIFSKEKREEKKRKKEEEKKKKESRGMRFLKWYLFVYKEK